MAQSRPARRDGGVNLYGFVGDGPINRIDVLGLWWWDGDYIEWGLGALLSLKGGPGTAGEAWSGFAEGWSKGGQGVINDFTGGLFGSEYGFLYDSFDKLDKDAFRAGIKCDSAFEFGSNAGRVAEASLLASGAVWGWNGAGLPTMDVAVGSGSPWHVAYGSGGTWVHASSVGGRGLGSLLVTEKGAEAYVVAYSWFQVTGIPILSPTAALATGGTAATCVGGACTGFVRGWLPFLPW